jgi:ATP-dependent RNA helicase RhlE
MHCPSENFMPFTQFGLPASLLRNVQALGYTDPTPIQAQAIPAIQGGRDVVGIAQTGTGKTAAFLLPVMEQLLAQRQRAAGALVLTPTRELATQIQSVFAGLAKATHLRSTVIIGGVAPSPQLRALREGVDLVVATPGRLLAHLRDSGASLSGVRTLILDEADQMFDMGFFPDVKNIIGRLTGRKQTLFFSATMPPEVATVGRSLLRDPVNVTVGTQGTAVESVRQVVYPVSAGRKIALLQHLLEQMENPSVLVFTRTRRGAKKVAKRLVESGHGVEELHADRSPSQRERAMRGFRARAFPILVATNIAARGLDIRHVTHVINYEVPDAPEEYVHRIGRTGRAGDEGDAMVFVSPEERPQLARIERRLGKPLERRKLTDFDYGPTNAEPAERPRKSGPRRPPVARPKQKVSRGQGRR